MAVTSELLPPRYADGERIAGGGMADIYAAEDTELGRKVAVKVLAARFAEDEDIRERFKREALTAARLSAHPHIVTIFDVGEWNGSPFIVMELLEGGTVAERIQAGGIGREQALAWLGQAADALDTAHAEGIVHRDVKPGNFLLDDGDLYVTDFGIARVLGDAAGGLTATGTILGTAGYLSPEQARGEEAMPVSDVYGLAVVAYELLTGGRPFERTTLTAEATAHVNEPSPPPSERADLPTAVDAVFARALAKDPAYRYPSARDFAGDLTSVLEGEAPTAVAVPPEAPTVALRRPRRRRRSLLLPSALGAALLGAGGLAAVLLSSGQGGVTKPPPSAPPTHIRSTAPAPAPVVSPPVEHGKGKKKGPKGKGKHKGREKHGEGGEGDQGTPIVVTPPPVTTVPVTAPVSTLGTTTVGTTTVDTTTPTTP